MHPTSTAGSSYQKGCSEYATTLRAQINRDQRLSLFDRLHTALKDWVRQRLTQKCFGQPAIDRNQRVQRCNAPADRPGKDDRGGGSRLVRWVV